MGNDHDLIAPYPLIMKTWGQFVGTLEVVTINNYRLAKYKIQGLFKHKMISCISFVTAVYMYVFPTCFPI